jgi:PAS domain S-box-containing protein
VKINVGLGGRVVPDTEHALYLNQAQTITLGGFIAADQQGVIGFWNAGAERIFGYPRDEAM